ncbi:MAG: bacterial transcriptional activator domain-containing protein [Bacteroidota bacterium]
MPKNNIGRTPTGNSRRRGQGANVETGDETLVDLVEVRDQAQGFVDRNRNLILGIAFGLAAVVIGYALFKTLYQGPREVTAAEEIMQAQIMFEQDSFQAALSNPGNGQLGFLDIIDDYGSTSAGNLANYYAAVSYLNLGEYEAALDYMKSFSANTPTFQTMKYGVMGDASGELGDYSDALGYYEDAIDAADENWTLAAYYQNKLALLLRNQGRNDEALEAFRTLKAEYGQSTEAQQADLYISLLGG